MGMFMSSMGTGVLYTQLLNRITDSIYDRLIHDRIKDSNELNIAILEFFSTLNAALPGKHYDAPRFEEVEKFFKKWEETKPEARKQAFVKFIVEEVKLNKIDDTTMLTGVVTPPIAMAAKRAGENVPQLKMIKAVPDVFFVPFATVLALFSVKISRRVFMHKVTS